MYRSNTYMKRPMKTSRKPRIVAKNCPFCNTKTEPDYKDTGVLLKYLTERGKILAESKTGICSKHQRALGEAIKRARIVALLPFIVRT